MTSWKCATTKGPKDGILNTVDRLLGTQASAINTCDPRISGSSDVSTLGTNMLPEMK